MFDDVHMNLSLRLIGLVSRQRYQLLKAHSLVTQQHVQIHNTAGYRQRYGTLQRQFCGSSIRLLHLRSAA